MEWGGKGTNCLNKFMLTVDTQRNVIVRNSSFFDGGGPAAVQGGLSLDGVIMDRLDCGIDTTSTARLGITYSSIGPNVTEARRIDAPRATYFKMSSTGIYSNDLSVASLALLCEVDR